MDYISKAEDVELLANELIKLLGEKISINRFALGQEVLSGKICISENKFIRLNGIDFNIKYSKGEFLRINVGEMDLLKPYEEKIMALNLLKNTISNILLTDKEKIGEPLAFYNIKISEFLIPNYEWAFEKKEEYISELENNTLFDDGAIIEGLIIFNKNIITEEKRLSKTRK